MKKTLVFTAILLAPLLSHGAEVDLIWQGGTYTPPFYKGLSLWSKQSDLTLVAVPQGFNKPSGLVYRWTLDGSVLGTVSGVGKDSLFLTDSILSKPRTIKIDIFSSDDTLLATNSLTLTPGLPQILVYEDNPLYGLMLHHEIGANFALKESEVTLAAVPLYFSASSPLDPALNYEWRTNSGSLETKNTVTYRVLDGQKGNSQVSLHINNKNKLMQDVSRAFSVEFGQQNGL
jgi:hypothetical protein